MALVVSKERAISKEISSVSVFEIGKYGAAISICKAPSTDIPPKPILIARPTEAGTYSVMVFFHGYCLGNNSYTDLFKHIASHGYIVVAPQLYYVAPCNELDSAASVINWLSKNGLQSALPKEVQPDYGKFVLAGHSRGGRAAFAVALGKVETLLAYSAVIGVDPVAGPSKSCQVRPKILTYVPHSFNIKAPILVIGAGLSEKPKACFMPACAPDGVNHKEFFNECRAPCCYFVATEYGHMDVLDDDPKPWGKFSYCMCTNGKERKPMREFVGGIIVAFLEAHLENRNADLATIFQDPSIAPSNLSHPSVYEGLYMYK